MPRLFQIGSLRAEPRLIRTPEGLRVELNGRTYLAALRHSRGEIQRLEQFTKLFFDGSAAPLADSPSK